MQVTTNPTRSNPTSYGFL